MSKTPILFRVSTGHGTFVYDLPSEEDALDAFAAEAGYRDYADLAATLGKSVEQAKADIVIGTCTLREALSKIIDETLESDAKDDGAEHPFKSVEDWAEWCWEGKTGDDAKAFARETKIDIDDVRAVIMDELRDCDLGAINEPFETYDDEAVGVA